MLKIGIYPKDAALQFEKRQMHPYVYLCTIYNSQEMEAT